MTELNSISNRELEAQISTFEKAKKLYKDKEYKEAFQILSVLMEQDFPPVFFLISLFYARGHYVIKNREIAVKVANQGVVLGHLGCKLLIYRYSNASVGFGNFLKYQIGLLPLLLSFSFVLFFRKGPKNRIRVLL